MDFSAKLLDSFPDRPAVPVFHRSRLTGWFKDGRIPNADHALAIAALLRREKGRAQRARQKG